MLLNLQGNLLFLSLSFISGFSDKQQICNSGTKINANSEREYWAIRTDLHE